MFPNKRRYDVEKVLSRLKLEPEKAYKKWVIHCQAGTHSDNNPSCHVRDDGSSKSGLFICRACKSSGDLPELVRLVLKLESKNDAKTWLSGDLAAPEPAPSTITLVIAQARHQEFKFPEGVVIAPLDRWPTPARFYVMNRGITHEQVDKWQLGYSIYGRLAGRIVIPIHDSSGRLVNYTGRTFCDAGKRYRNPEEWEKPNTSVLFGEQFWSLRDTIVVTEGGINTLAIERVFPDVSLGALSGSNISIGALGKLASFRRVIVATDPDLAGNVAATKLIMGLKRHTFVTRVEFAPGTDAAALHPSALCAILEPVIKWKNETKPKS